MTNLFNAFDRYCEMSTSTLDVSKEAHACNHDYVYIYCDPRTAHALGQFCFCNISGSDGQFSYVFHCYNQK